MKVYPQHILPVEEEVPEKDAWRRCSDWLFFDGYSIQCMYAVWFQISLCIGFVFLVKMWASLPMTDVEVLVLGILLFFVAVHCVFRCKLEKKLL